MTARVTYSDELRAYMGRKGMRDVLIETYQPHACGSAAEQVVRLIGTREARDLREKGASHLTGEMGDVFVGAARIPEGDATVALGLRRCLGIADVTVEGLLPLRRVL